MDRGGHVPLEEQHQIRGACRQLGLLHGDLLLVRSVRHRAYDAETHTVDWRRTRRTSQGTCHHIRSLFWFVDVIHFVVVAGNVLHHQRILNKFFFLFFFFLKHHTDCRVFYFLSIFLFMLLMCVIFFQFFFFLLQYHFLLFISNRIEFLHFMNEKNKKFFECFFFFLQTNMTQLKIGTIGSN